MPIDFRLLNVAITHHAAELHRLLRVKRDHSGTAPDHAIVLIAALLDFIEAEEAAVKRTA